jgi:hypothetical protein
LIHKQFLIQGSQYKAQRPGSMGLLMTATLNPPKEAVARSDARLRLDDYRSALQFYLTLSSDVIDKILFVDNSAGDLHPLMDIAQQLVHDKRVEFISFDGNNHDPKLGKAYGEFKLIDFGLTHTQLFESNDVIWKTTGRLKVLNLDLLAESARALIKQQSLDLLCDLHNIPLIGSGQWNNKYVDLRLFAFRYDSWNALFLACWRDLDVAFDATFLFHHILEKQASLHVIPRFPVQPLLSGVSGRHMRDYGAPLQRFKDNVRNVQRHFLPWLWL